MDAATIFGAVTGAAAGVAFPAAMAWRLLAVLDRRLGGVERRLDRIAAFLAAALPPETTHAIEGILGPDAGNGSPPTGGDDRR